MLLQACGLWSRVSDSLRDAILGIPSGSCAFLCGSDRKDPFCTTDSPIFSKPQCFSVYRNITVLIQQSEFKGRPVTQSLLSRMEKLRYRKIKEIVPQDICTPGNWIWLFRLICRVWSSAGRWYWKSSFQSGLSSWHANPRWSECIPHMYTACLKIETSECRLRGDRVFCLGL